MVPALTALRTAVCPEALPCGPAGHALVPEDIAETFDHGWADGSGAPRAADREDRLTEIAVSGGVLVALRRRDEAPVDVHRAPVRAWTLGLAWVRLGLSEQMLDTCMTYLRGRVTGAGTLLNQQMVKGSLAEVAIEHLEIETMMDGALPGDLDIAATVHLHAQITRADRMLLRLLGAYGFLADGPGQVAWVSELLADVYVGPPAEGGPR
ncbi:hypothetical protein DZF91_09535 [Actinomadura logoneensis]|uniref:Acyl-CoA dehydrogenase/oxidase C-terminal domain-containing protein n=1 Tax=Actinomadura logoneensis TaxID=2293572 RepID=A0A372JPZ4_9ACTN|nr:hypothetical protein [Actinomadura logoneensis]RFU41886.1 hypothetical protein DZF91_09535 [Actinomadura logoneensis]